MKSELYLSHRNAELFRQVNKGNKIMKIIVVNEEMGLIWYKSRNNQSKGNEIMKNQINKLTLSWSTSKGRDTYGYNICRLDDRNNGKRFRCMGGGYDMIGTVFGDWLETYYQKELMAIKDRSDRFYNDRHYLNDNSEKDTFYGMTYNQVKDYVHLDGACGIESMIRIAEAIGLEIERDYIAKGRRRGETIGWFVQMKDIK